ncbi:unnamed protein product [Thelazia callipaeda]|uniref:Protein transport protein sec16 n=1 Tax=Thelazia callipaeda TaxID=103827 RepID=A0A0N5D2U9_THECL|nr:unnamed protein product [Thelazia callipaeda]
MRYSAMPITAPNEFYYFGVIQLPQVSIEYIMRRIPPPPEYYGLPPVEKAAYLFYCLLYQHHYHPVDLFHKKFNREYFSYMCEGDSAEIALWKICKHTQEEFLAKRSANHLKAYEMSQKQLFSDDRETLDSRFSFSGFHFLSWSRPFTCVQLLLDVKNSETVLEIRDMRSLIVDQKLLYVVSAIESFRGPLVPGFTQTHSVLLYIQRQIDIILKSEAYLNSGANDCLLMWQLLEMLVQQQGRVTGPDLSRLLMNGCHVIEHRRNENQVDPKAYDRFTQFLLGGHVKEALDSAMKDGLYSDAMILARRIAINEPHELDKVETAFLSHRSDLNPVMTLLAVANGQSASVLTNPPVDDANSWRPHAAIILANLNTPAAFGAVYQLGHALGRREMHIAADFCYLAVSLLAPSYNPFSPCFESRQHITLIHATLPGDGALNFESLNGFSVIDLHATEIFQFATKLADGWISQNLNRSIAYQMHRLEYTEMVSEFGNSVDAFRYCVEIARDIWNRCHEINIKHLERLYELAESLIDERRKRIQAVEGVLSCISEEVDTVPDLTEVISLHLLINFQHGHGSGIFSKLKATIAKAIPASNEMILPDDKNPSIVWDPKLNRYVGEGIEEKSVPEPPPSVKSNSEAVNGPSSGRIGGLTAARLSGGSRYFNPLIETLPSKPVAQTLPLLPPTLVTASFGFIPSTPGILIQDSRS